MGILDVDSLIHNPDYDIEVWIRENYIILGELKVHNKIANVNGSVKYKHKSGSLTNNNMFTWGKVTKAFDITNLFDKRSHILEIPNIIWGETLTLKDKAHYLEGVLSLNSRGLTVYRQNIKICNDGILEIINFND